VQGLLNYNIEEGYAGAEHVEGLRMLLSEVKNEVEAELAKAAGLGESASSSFSFLFFLLQAGAVKRS
jgi:hypothetical protein